MKLSLLVPVALLLSLPLVGPDPALAQIASPGNAGGNSGNNSSGSSSTSISSPSFTSVTPVSTAPDVSVSPDGSVTAPQTTVDAVDQAVAVAIVGTSIQSVVLGTSAGDAIGSQLVASGAPQAQVDDLMASVQGLANQPTLTALSDSINAFNSIVSSASPEALTSLAADPAFSDISAVLQEARAALSTSLAE